MTPTSNDIIEQDTGYIYILLPFEPKKMEHFWFHFDSCQFLERESIHSRCTSETEIPYTRLLSRIEHGARRSTLILLDNCMEWDQFSSKQISDLRDRICRTSLGCSFCT